MEKKRKISEYRERLDKTLSSPELTNEETLKSLVKSQLVHSSQNDYEGCINNVVDKRTSEVSNFLDMLRSASVNDHELSKSTEAAHGEWKLKQDTEEFRVMYREGPQGTPFHTLLAEGYVDGPVDVCLCISWQSELYKKWWPQSNIPPFKISISECLQKIRIGEQITLVRMKLMWPLSTREAVVHYYVFEYLQDDLIIALINTIPDLQTIDKSTHGYTNDGIPEAKDVVRIDVVGGFALQKVTRERSYFRTIATMDIKLDFVPPSLINFISRQLIGNGFRLYQKTVTCVSKNNEDYSRALRDPLYARIREAFDSIDKTNGALDGEELNSGACNLPVEGILDDLRNMEQELYVDDREGKSLTEDAEVTVRKDVGEIKEEKIEEIQYANNIMENLELEVHDDGHARDLSPRSAQAITKKAFGEIEEEESEESVRIESGEEGDELVGQPSVSENGVHHNVEVRKKVVIRPEVEQALGILDKAISMLREYGFNEQTRSSAGLINGEHPASAKSEAKELTSLETDGVCSNGEISKKDTIERTSHDSSNGSGSQDNRNTRSNSYSREVNHNRIAPASPEEYFSIPIDTKQIAFSSTKNWTKELPVPHRNSDDNKQVRSEPNGSIHDHDNSINEGKKFPHKKFGLCCFFSSGV